jgi:hypothetical protein
MNTINAHAAIRRNQSGATRTPLLLLLAFGLGFAVSSALFLQRGKESPPPVSLPKYPAPAARIEIPPAVASIEQPLTPVPVNEDIVAELNKTFPDLATRSFDDMAATLRARALDEFKTATVEMQKKLQAAQAELSQAQKSQIASESFDAVNQFQKLQQEQSAQLVAITARVQERIQTLERLKKR